MFYATLLFNHAIIKLGMMGNHNNLKQLRAKAMLSKAELARKAGVSVLTITRIEQGMECRTGTKRRIRYSRIDNKS